MGKYFNKVSKCCSWEGKFVKYSVNVQYIEEQTMLQTSNSSTIDYCWLLRKAQGRKTGWRN